MLTKVQSNIEKVSLRQEQLESLLAAASALGVVGLLQGAPNKGFIAWFFMVTNMVTSLEMAKVVARFLLSLVMFSLAGLVMKLMSGNTFDFEATKTVHHRRNTEGSPFKSPSSD